MNVSKLIEEPINCIWKKYNALTKNIPPLAVESIPHDAIIFIGINPSLGNSDRKRLEVKNDKSIEFYELPSKENYKKPHKYFTKFYEIGKRLNIPIGHLDVLYMRETQQSTVKDLFKTNKGIQFIYEQLQVTKNVINEIVTKSNPKAFVVNNTLARDFMGKFKHFDKYGNSHYHPNIDEEKEHWMNFLFDWDDELGTYILEIKEVKKRKIPFFFTSMLTGQRALDNDSFDRLI